MKCKNCNHTLPTDSEFCQYCGVRIEGPIISPVPDEEAAVSSPALQLPDFNKMTPDEALNAILQVQAKNTVEAMEANSKIQPNNEGDVDFGLVPEKPIFTLALKSVEGEKEYLEKLYTVNGEKIKYHRRGSTSVNGINGMIDIYETYLPSGQPYTTIYINMYGAYESTKAPIGFTFNNDVTKKCQKVKKEKSVKTKYCSKCGSVIDNKTKACTGCGKRIFRYDIVIICVLIVLIILISSILLSQHQQNNPNTSNSNATETNSITNYTDSNIESEHTNFHNELNKGDYTQVTVTDLYNNPQKYHRQFVALSAYNIFYTYNEPTYSENFYDMYLMGNLSDNIDNSESGLGKEWASQFMAYHNLLDKEQPHLIARTFEQNVNNVLYGLKISSNTNLTNKQVTVYGYFTYNPNTEGYISDPEVFQLEVHAYGFL